MVLKVIWRKIRLYRRFEIDIWGVNLLSLNRTSQVIRLFDFWEREKKDLLEQRRSRYIYRIDLDQPQRIKKKFKRHFIIRKFSRLFYLTLSYSQFKRLAHVATRMEGSWESNFIMLIENRVLGMLYRMQVLLNVFELKSFIIRGKVLINNKKITYYNALINYYDIVTFSEFDSVQIRYDIIKRFSRGSLYFNIPRYMFISYKLMFAFVFTEPKRKDLSFPIKFIDVYRSADFF